MACILLYKPKNLPPQDFLTGKIRLSIFFIIGECAGLPAVVWALRFLYRCYKAGSRVSAFIITLLLCDLLVLLLNPYILTKLLQDDLCWERSMTCRILSSLCSASLICGIHLQQIVALEAALLLRYPFHFAHVFFPSCSSIIAIIMLIVFFLCEVLGGTPFIIFALPLLLVITSISWVVTCRTPPNINETLYKPRKPSLTVLAFVTLTLILYGTFSIVWVTLDLLRIFWGEFGGNLFVMGVSLMSLHIIIDPLLCVIISRKATELNQSEVSPSGQS